MTPTDTTDMEDSTGISEIFNQARMGRATGIGQQLYNHWVKRRVFKYIVRVRENLTGASLEDMKHWYYSVGPDRNHLTDIPFLDLLVAFDMVRQLMKGPGPDGKAEFKIKTAYSDIECVEMLSQIEFCSLDFPEGKSPRFESHRDEK